MDPKQKSDLIREIIAALALTGLIILLAYKK